MTENLKNSLSDDATFAGAAKRRLAAEMSLGDERTLGDRLGDQDTVIDDIEVVDLEARYKVEGTLGQGGMGAVLLATDTRLGRKVAVKRILGEAARSKTAIMRFLTEAKAIAALNHPNIVQIYDYGRAKDGPFLIMEYVDGGSLLDRCREGALPLEDAVDLACQLCDGLAKAHDAGIVHRDIKPANVLLNKDGLPKLTDFGLAKAEATDHQMTMTGAVMGTPDFMPPEQRRDASEVDARSDLWSLAATVYQMVTGRSPKIIRFRDVPESIQEVLGKALEDRKDARYQTARELRDALRSASVSSVSVDKPRLVLGKLHEGQCKACGTVTSDLTKKFCRNSDCGASLRVACLKCDTQIPVWDGVCGECGGNQPALLEAQRTELLAKQAEAEALVQAFAFEDALAKTDELSKQTHPELAALAQNWAAAFVESATAERDRWQSTAAERLREADAHVAAWDYPTAIHAIEAIPEPLRDAKATKLLEECLALKSESELLIATITERIKTKDLDGLLPVVERAVTLRGDRHDLVKIRVQLLERRDSIARAREAQDRRDAEVAMAREHIAHRRFREAMASLARIDASLVDAESEALEDTAKEALEKISSLEDLIWPKGMAGDAIDLDDKALFSQVEELLTLDPANAKALALRDRIYTYHKEAVALANRDAVQRVQQLLADRDFAGAIAVVNSVPPNDIGPELAALLEKAQALHSEYTAQLTHVQQCLSQAFAERSYSEVNDLLREYRVLKPHDDWARVFQIEIHKLLEAQRLLAHHSYADAGKVLETIDKTIAFLGFSAWSKDCETMLHKAEEGHKQVLTLATRLKTALAKGSRQDIAATADSYLQLKPNDQRVQKVQKAVEKIDGALAPIAAPPYDWIEAFDLLMQVPAQLRNLFPELFGQAYSEACTARRIASEHIEQATKRLEKASRLGGFAGVLWWLTLTLFVVVPLPHGGRWGNILDILASATGPSFFVGFLLLLCSGLQHGGVRRGSFYWDFYIAFALIAFVLAVTSTFLSFNYLAEAAQLEQMTFLVRYRLCLPVLFLFGWGPSIGVALWVNPSLFRYFLINAELREQMSLHKTLFPEDTVPDGEAGFKERLFKFRKKYKYLASR